MRTIIYRWKSTRKHMFHTTVFWLQRPHFVSHCGTETVCSLSIADLQFQILCFSKKQIITKDSGFSKWMNLNVNAQFRLKYPKTITKIEHDCRLFTVKTY